MGRLETNDIPIQDKKASREHAKIYKQGDQYAIVDLNSSNGTFVNGDKITKRILKPGDVIEVGLVKMRFEDPEAEAAKAAAAKAGARKSLDEAFDAAQKGETKGAGAAAAAGGATARDVVMRGHKPLQYSRVKPGKPIIGFDLDQMSDMGRVIVYIGLVAVFAGLMYLAYTLVAA